MPALTDLEGAMTAIAEGRFDDFDRMQRDQLREVAEARRHDAAERAALAAAAARMAASDDGRLILDWLCARTLGRITFFAQGGMTMEQVAVPGLIREGMNQLVFELLRLVAEGRGETLPPRT